jgi:predicted PurR-regulated permease PerM
MAHDDPARPTTPPSGPESFAPRTKTAFALAIAFVVVLAIYWMRGAVFLTFVGLLVGILVSHFADVAARRVGLPRKVAVVLFALLFFAIAAGLVAVLAVPLVEQFSRLASRLPGDLERIERRLQEFRAANPTLASYLPTIGAGGEGMSSERATKIALTAFAAARWTLEGAVGVVTVFFLALFFALDPDRYVRGVATLVPGPPEPRVWLMYRCGQALRAWMIATGIEMAAVAAMWTLGLWFFQVDYFLLFGIVGGFCEVVPYYGPILGFVPPLLISATVGPSAMLAVTAIYVVIHLIDGYLLLPLLLDRQVKLPPVAVLVAIVALGKALGVWGIVLSMPLLTVAYVVVNRVYLWPAEYPRDVGTPEPA